MKTRFDRYYWRDGSLMYAGFDRISIGFISVGFHFEGFKADGE